MSSPAPQAAAPAPQRDSPRAWRSPRAWIILILSLVLGLAADLGSKNLAFAHVATGHRATDGVGGPVIVRRQQALSLPPSQINSIVPRHEALVVLPYALELRLVLNPGAVFGIGPGKQKFFVGFTVLALAFGFWMFGSWTRAADRWAHIAIAIVLAGGLGNLYDRLIYGCVRDFLHPLPGVNLPFGLTWPGGDRQAWPYVSNVADALLLVGIAVLLVRLWKHPQAAKPEAKLTPPAGAPLPHR